MMCSFFHLFIYKELTLGWIFDTTQYIVSSKFIRVDQYFNFIIVNPKNINLHKSIEQNGRGMFWAISEIFYANPKSKFI